LDLPLLSPVLPIKNALAAPSPVPQQGTQYIPNSTEFDRPAEESKDDELMTHREWRRRREERGFEPTRPLPSVDFDHGFSGLRREPRREEEGGAFSRRVFLSDRHDGGFGRHEEREEPRGFDRGSRDPRRESGREWGRDVSSAFGGVRAYGNDQREKRAERRMEREEGTRRRDEAKKREEEERKRRMENLKTRKEKLIELRESRRERRGAFGEEIRREEPRDFNSRPHHWHEGFGGRAEPCWREQSFGRGEDRGFGREEPRGAFGRRRVVREEERGFGREGETRRGLWGEWPREEENGFGRRMNENERRGNQFAYGDIFDVPSRYEEGEEREDESDHNGGRNGRRGLDLWRIELNEDERKDRSQEGYGRNEVNPRAVHPFRRREEAERRREKRTEKEEAAYKMASQIPALMAMEILRKALKESEYARLMWKLNEYISHVQNNIYSLKPHPRVFAHGNDVELIGNIAVDLEKHLSKIHDLAHYSTPDNRDELFRKRIDQMREALQMNGAMGEEYTKIAKELRPILLTGKYTSRDAEPHGIWHDEFVGFMAADPRRDFAAPPRVPSANPEMEGLFAPVSRGCKRVDAPAEEEKTAEREREETNHSLLEELIATDLFDDYEAMVKVCAVAGDLREAIDMMVNRENPPSI
ncbi:hypothetical protein PMAYCL1PPCAC_28623, partial [Pristionchus mayeri]